jgi:hypothetical protein
LKNLLCCEKAIEVEDGMEKKQRIKIQRNKNKKKIKNKKKHVGVLEWIGGDCGDSFDDGFCV